MPPTQQRQLLWHFSPLDDQAWLCSPLPPDQADVINQGGIADPKDLVVQALPD